MEYDFIDKTILIVEDEECSRLLLEKALKKTGADLYFVNNGMAALNFLEVKPQIDAILMDVRLPVMDGMTATRKIKEFRPHLPVIIQTAYVISPTREEILKCGCDDFITKPIHTGTLLSILDKHFHG